MAPQWPFGYLLSNHNHYYFLRDFCFLRYLASDRRATKSPIQRVIRKSMEKGILHTSWNMMQKNVVKEKFSVQDEIFKSIIAN